MTPEQRERAKIRKREWRLKNLDHVREKQKEWYNKKKGESFDKTEWQRQNRLEKKLIQKIKHKSRAERRKELLEDIDKILSGKLDPFTHVYIKETDNGTGERTDQIGSQQSDTVLRGESSGV